MPQKVLNATQTNVGVNSGQLPTYEVGSWTPTFTGLTAVDWVGSTAGRYTKIGNTISFQVVITTTSGTIASVAGTSYCDLPAPASQHSNVLASNAVTLIGIGTGMVNATTDRVMVPTWTATGDTIVISGTYEV